MKRRCIFGVGFLLAALASPLGWGASETQESWYARKLTRGDTPLRVEHFWSKGRRLRAQTVVVGHPVVTIVNGDHYYILDELTSVGLAIQRSPAARKADLRGGRPFGNEAERIVKEGGEKVRSEQLADRLCEVYRVTNARGRQEVWVTRDEPRLPIRVEIFDRASGRSGRNDYLDWSRDLRIPDSFFEPDPRFVIERLGYQEYLTEAAKGAVGPAPVFYSELLHGK